MSDTPTGVQPPKWYWVVSIVALIWNLMGLMAYVMQMTMSDTTLQQFPAERQELYNTMPGWVKIAFGVAVIGGAIGCGCLIARKRWALPILVLSLLGVLVQMSYIFFLSNTLAVMGPSAFVMPLFVIVIGALLVWFAKMASDGGWLQ